MLKHLRKNAILVLFVVPLLALFGLASVRTAAAGSDPVQLVEQYLAQQRVSAETRSEISSELQEAINQGTDPAKMAEMVNMMIRERVQANGFEQLAETLKEMAKAGNPDVNRLMNDFRTHLQEGMKAGKALGEALEAAEDLAKVQQEQLREQDREQEQDQEREHEGEDVDDDGKSAAGGSREGEGDRGRND